MAGTCLNTSVSPATFNTIIVPRKLCSPTLNLGPAHSSLPTGTSGLCGPPSSRIPTCVSPASLPLSSHHEVTTEVTKAEQPSPGWEGKLRTPRARAPRVSMPRIRQRELDCSLSLGRSGSRHQDNLKFSRLPVGPSHLPFRWGRRGAGDRSDTLGPQSKVESMATKGIFKQTDPEPLVSR